MPDSRIKKKQQCFLGPTSLAWKAHSLTPSQRQAVNQRGEMNLVFVLLVAGLSGVMILCALSLYRSFRLLEKRTELFLCVKETEGELVQYMRFMGRTNWALKNIRKAQLIMVFIPGLQGAVANAEKLRKTLVTLQDLTLVPYLKKLREMRSRGCPLDPRLLITPFHLSGRGYQRGTDGSARLREEKWKNLYISFPYTLSIEWNVRAYESVNPQIQRTSSEIGARLSSVLRSY